MPFTNEGPAIWVNADKSAVVEEGSADAAFLLVGAGGTLTDEDAAKYGLDTKAAKAKAAPEANKAKVSATENKAKG